MKTSYYNVVVDIPGSDESVLYNTRTSAIACLGSEERAVYDLLLEGGKPGEAEAPIVSELADGGFLVENPEFEANMLQYQFERYRYSDAILELYVAPTMGCNFDCPYCFEHKREGSMSQAVQDALLGFVREEYDERPFEELKIVWYGGEPLLQIDTIVELSKRFIAFAEEAGIEYVASIISNTSLANEEVQQKLIDSRVWSIMTTLDGEKEIHDARRVNKAGESTFDTIMRNVDSMTEKGICVDFRCILEKGNVESCLRLTEQMANRDNLGIRVKPMRDMSKFGRDVPGAAEVEALEPEDYADAFYKVFLQKNPTVEDYERALEPIRLHCSAAMERGYAIDELGNAFNCGCAIGDDSKILFNICEPKETRKVNWDLKSWYNAHNPVAIERCRGCRVLPLCQGGCLRRDEEPFSECNPMKYIIEDMVLGYYEALVAQQESS